MNKDKLEKIGNAFSIITFGVICLLLTLGYVQFDSILNFLFRFWPVFIIFVGLKLFLGSLPFGKVLNFVVDVLFNLLIVFSFLYYPQLEIQLSQRFEIFKNDQKTTSIKDLDIKSSEYDKSQIKKIKLKMDIGAAKFDLKTSDTLDYLGVTGKYSQKMYAPEVISSFSDSELTIRFKQEFIPKITLGAFPNSVSELSFVVGNKDIPLLLDIDLGAGSGNVDLTDSTLEEVKLDIGAGSTVLILSKDLSYQLKYDVGAGKVNIFRDSVNIKSIEGLANTGTYQIGEEIGKLIDVNVGAGSLNIYLQ